MLSITPRSARLRAPLTTKCMFKTMIGTMFCKCLAISFYSRQLHFETLANTLQWPGKLLATQYWKNVNMLLQPFTFLLQPFKSALVAYTGFRQLERRLEHWWLSCRPQEPVFYEKKAIRANVKIIHCCIHCKAIADVLQDLTAQLFPDLGKHIAKYWQNTCRFLCKMSLSCKYIA